MKAKSIIITVFGLTSGGLTLGPAALAAPQSCTLSSHTHAKVQLTTQGIARLSERVLSPLFSKAEGALAGKPLPPVEFGPNKADCTREKMAKMELGDAWKRCYGMPAILSGTAKGWSGAAAPEPTSFKLDSLTLRDVRFGAPKVSCTAQASDPRIRNCNVQVPIEKLRLKGSFTATSLHSGNRLMHVRDWELEAAGEPKSPPPTVSIDVRISPDGKMTDLLRAEQSSFQVKIPAEAFKVGLADFEETLLREWTSEALFRSYHAFREMERYPEIQDRAEIIRFMGGLEERELFRSKEHVRIFSEVGGAAYADVMMETLRSHFGSDHEAVIFGFSTVAGNWLMSQPGVADKISQLVATHTAPQVSTTLNSYLENVPYLHEQASLTIPGVTGQDLVDAEKIRTASGKLQKAIAGVKHRPSKRGIHEIREQTEAFTRMIHDSSVSTDALSQLAAVEAELSFVSPETNRKDLQKAFDAVSRKKARLATNIEEAALTLHLRALASRSGSLQNEVELIMAACTGANACAERDCPPLLGQKSGAGRLCKGAHDFAVQVDVDAVNALLAQLFERGVFDICQAGNPDNTCSSSKWPASRSWLTVRKPPAIRWDPEKKKNYLELIVHREATMLGSKALGALTPDSTANVKLHLEIVRSEDGSGIRFAAVDMGAIPWIDDSNLSSLLGDLTRYINPLMTMTHAIAMHQVAIGLERKIRASDVPQFAGAKITELHSDEGSMYACGEF